MSLLTQQIEQLARRLRNASCKLVTAESCTGGQLAALLTDRSGSSAWFERGYVTYSNAAKQELLAVPLKTLTQFGAVSPQTAIAMAKGALQNSHAHYSIAITGVAGPDGGTTDKPVGSICFAWGNRNGSIDAAQAHFEGSRLEIRAQACLFSVQKLCKQLEQDGAKDY